MPPLIFLALGIGAIFTALCLPGNSDKKVTAEPPAKPKVRTVIRTKIRRIRVKAKTKKEDTPPP